MRNTTETYSTEPLALLRKPPALPPPRPKLCYCLRASKWLIYPRPRRQHPHHSYVNKRKQTPLNPLPLNPPQTVNVGLHLYQYRCHIALGEPGLEVTSIYLLVIRWLLSGDSLGVRPSRRITIILCIYPYSFV
jgi:hypothetical protein